MKNLTRLTLIVLLSLFWSCNNNDDTNINEPSSIEIGNYVFKFPTEFVLEEEQGIDSYVGNIKGSGISLSFDYGWYTRPATNLPEKEYTVIEDEISGHYRQVVRPLNSMSNYTKIHLFKISNSIDSPNGYNSLTISTNNLSTTEQEMIIKIFNNVEIIK